MMMHRWMITVLIFSCSAFRLTAATVNESAFDSLGPSLLSAFMKYTEDYMTGELHDLQTLADTRAVQSGDWQEMQTLLKRYARTGRSALVWFAHPDGSYYTTAKDKVAANLSDRKYFPDLIQGKPIIGFPIIGKTSGKKSLVVAVPVRRNDTIIGALGSSLYLEDLDLQVKEALSLPENIVFYALDGQGETLLNSKLSRLFIDPRQVNNPSLKKAVEQMLRQGEGTVTYRLDNQTKKALFKRSALLNWHFALAVSLPSATDAD